MFHIKTEPWFRQVTIIAILIAPDLYSDHYVQPQLQVPVRLSQS
jgi:hypothetical protein